MSDGRVQSDGRYMVVRSDSDGQLTTFESVQPVRHIQAPHTQAPLYQSPQQHEPQSHAQVHAPDPPPAVPPVPRQQFARIVNYPASNRSRANSRSSHGHSQPSTRAHSRNPSIAAAGARRTRTNTAASSEGSVTSESEFITYRDGNGALPGSHRDNQGQQPYIAGLQYGPYSYLNYPQNMAAERYYSQESLKMQRSGSGSGSGSSHGHYYPHDAAAGYQNLPQRAGPPVGAPMMHAFGSTSTSSFGSYGSQQGHFPYTSSTGGTRRPGHVAQASSLNHDSIQVITQPNYTANHALETHFLYDAKNPEQDDFMHNPTQHDAIVERRTCSLVSIRGFLNVVALVLIMLTLIGMFGAYPVISEVYHRQMSYMGSYGLGGTNASGQVPDIPGLPGLIDSHTPESAYKRTGFDGFPYNLVFSDEFEVEGRTFYPGDDPYWEAVDLHYWGTGDYEWNDPQAIVTRDGHLEITISKQRQHDLDYQGGMLQSWNKLCFTGGYIEVSVSLPGTPQVSGFWPGVWTMGNLGRPGYGATTEGVWPYSYNSCDVGTVKNQTINGQPASAAGLSFQPGQKLSGCTCKGEEHPGPNTRTGRGAPEIDIIEAQNSNAAGRMQGEVSQSAQIAPYDSGYHWKQSSPASTIYNSDLTQYNSYIGGPLQEAVSAVTLLEDEGYEVNGGFRKYGFEYRPGGDDNAFITWMYDDKPTWKVTAATFPADSETQVAQRLVSEEPMSIIFNLHMSDSFQYVDLANLPFPSKLRIDYVRIYQREGEVNLSCSPKDYPTADYINDHLNAYSNPNLTTWKEAGYTFPKNRLVDEC